MVVTLALILKMHMYVLDLCKYVMLNWYIV